MVHREKFNRLNPCKTKEILFILNGVEKFF